MTGTARPATPASPDQGPRASSGNDTAGAVAGHVAGLDGIRGLAVAAVVAYHLGYRWAKGGYLGVDTFLVLSGYLITTGLVWEHSSPGRIALGRFWARRVQRLLPALV